MNIIKTKAQIKREKEHTKIFAMYTRLRESNPDASDNAIYETIASRMGWTRVGVSKVVARRRECQESNL